MTGASTRAESGAHAAARRQPFHGRQAPPADAARGESRGVTARPTPGLDRLLAAIRQSIGAGLGWPSDHVLAARMGWTTHSTRDALRRLAARGDIMRAGSIGRGWSRRTLWVLTPAGLAPPTKWCRACTRDLPASAFYRSPHTADGRSLICARCTRAAAERATHHAIARASRRASRRLA